MSEHGSNSESATSSGVSSSEIRFSLQGGQKPPSGRGRHSINNKRSTSQSSTSEQEEPLVSSSDQHTKDENTKMRGSSSAVKPSSPEDIYEDNHRQSHAMTDRSSSTGNGDEEDSDTTTSPKQPQEKLGTIAVAFFVFVSTAAGPFGVEGTVNSAGPMPTLLFTFLCPIVIIIPICLMMEELGSWMPTNHGSIRWVARGLGPTAGFFNAYYQQLMNTVDIAVYPAMASDYIFQKFAKDTELEDNFAARYFTRLGIIILFGAPNYLPMRDIGMLSAVITLIIMSPFLVGFFAGAKNLDTSSWNQVNTGPDFDLSTLLAVGLWMYTGFLANSNITGECKPRSLLKGQLIAIFFDILFYFLPLAVVFQLDTDWNNWSDGYLVQLFDEILPGLGYAVAIAGAFSGIGLYVSSLATYCRTMWGIAEFGWLPKLLRKTNRYNVPWVNVTILLVTTSLLNLLDFDFLVKLEFVFASFTYIFFVLAFLFLKYREPYHTRPPWAWQVPFGECFAIIMPMPLIFLVSSVIGSDFTDLRLLLSWLGMTILGFCLHVYLGKNRTHAQVLALKRLIAGEEAEDELDEVDLRATEVCPIPGQVYE